LFPYPGLTAWAKLWRTSGASERAGLEQPFEAPLEARDKQGQLKLRPLRKQKEKSRSLGLARDDQIREDAGLKAAAT